MVILNTERPQNSPGFEYREKQENWFTDKFPGHGKFFQIISRSSKK